LHRHYQQEHLTLVWPAWLLKAKKSRHHHRRSLIRTPLQLLLPRPTLISL
jgi:hypothetical protein